MIDVNTFIYISWVLLFLLGMRTGLFLFLSYFHYLKNRWIKGSVLDYNPRVSVIVPCYNEEKVLENCVNSLLKQDYMNMEIIIVDDGSTDKTKRIGIDLEKRYIEKVKFLSKPNSGKAGALNHAILRSSGEIVICIDADSMFLKDTVRNLITPFFDKKVAAVAGNVKVANRKKFINKHQAVEYISGLNLQRRSFAVLDSIQVISGAVGAYRKDLIFAAGGYSDDTLVEDMDITLALLENGGKVVYNPRAIAYTEAPETLKDFIKQRYRWIYGRLQVLKKYNHLVFNSKYKALGMFGLPFYLVFPWLDVLVSIYFVYYVSLGLISGNITEFAIFYSVTVGLQVSLMTYCAYIDKEDKKLVFISLFENLWYYHLINLITLKAGVNYLRGSQTSWNKLERFGKNILPNKALGF